MSACPHRLLVLGSMDEFCGIVRKARERGIQTVLVDGYADGPAKALADFRRDVDVRDTEAVVAVANELEVDGIITAFSDVLAENYAKIAQAAGLKAYLTPDRLRYLRDKSLMKSMFDELGIAYPKTVSVRRDSALADLATLDFPVVTKPVDTWGSHGVYLLDTAQEVVERYDDVAGYTDADRILVEEYDDGYELNVMSWVVDGEPVVLEIADREKTPCIEHATPHVSRICYPSVLTDLLIDDVREILSKVAHYVGLECGPLCMQAFWSPERGLKVCECAGRIFGYEHEVLEYATDGELTIEDLLLDCVYDPDEVRRRLAGHDPHLRHPSATLDFHGFEGTVARIEGVPSPDDPGIEAVYCYYAPGDKISHAVGAKPYTVRVDVSASDRVALDELSDRLFAEVSVRDAEGRELLMPNRRMSYERAFGGPSTK